MSGRVSSILVLDDEEMIRESLQFYLESDGWEVVGAGSAEEALSLLTKRSFDVAIVDIRLPGMSGRDFVIAAHAVRPELRFLIFTGSAVFQLDEGLRGAGMAPGDVFTKPLEDLQVLSDAARGLLVQGHGDA